MPLRLDSQSADFPGRFAAFLGVKREAAEDVEQSRARHHRRGEGGRRPRADRADPEIRPRRSRQDRLARERRRDRGGGARLRTAARWPRSSSRASASRPITAGRSRPTSASPTRSASRLGGRWTAIEAVGFYVPGGTAAYPSSVLMNAVPAKVAGCPRLVMVVPAPDGKLSPLVLAAAKLAGVDEVYRIGGAQAVAALAYGTETIAPVAKIVGPGNAYVAAAKRLVFGQVGIDMIAGPSEVLILADKTGNADWIAADLLAQAEHDASAQSILITDDAALADEVEKAVDGAAQDACRARRSPPPPGAISAPSSRWPSSTTPCRWSIAWRPSIWRSSPPMPRRSPPHPQCRRHLHRRAYAGSDRRLCRRLQPRAADRALGAFLLGPRRARFHEAHLAAQMRPRAIARARARGHRARRGGRACRPCPLGRHPPQPAMSAEQKHRRLR